MNNEVRLKQAHDLKETAFNALMCVPEGEAILARFMLEGIEHGVNEVFVLSPKRNKDEIISAIVRAASGQGGLKEAIAGLTLTDNILEKAAMAMKRHGPSANADFAQWSAGCLALVSIKKGSVIKKEVVEANMPLAISIATGFLHKIREQLPMSDSLDDLIQEGLLGMLKAVEKYDPNKKVKFSTYAYWWIKDAMGKSLKKLAHVTNRKFVPMESLDAPLGEDGQTLGDTLEHFDEWKDPNEGWYLEVKGWKRKLTACLRKLTPKQRLVIGLAYGVDLPLPTVKDLQQNLAF